MPAALVASSQSKAKASRSTPFQVARQVAFGVAISEVDPNSKKVTAKLSEPHSVGLALAAGSVWAAVIDSANVDRIDPHTGRLSGRVHVGGTPVRLAAGFGSVWVNDDNGRVLRIQSNR